jgi:penicillin-binding protein 1A
MPNTGAKPARLRVSAAALAVAVVASGCSMLHLPPIERPRIPPLPQTSLMFDARGRLITALHAGEDRTLIPFERMPETIRDAVVATEDERFYQHRGVDAKAIVRAAVKNATEGHVVQGGSTITEQLVKNTITGSDRTLGRKVREARLAFQLEKEYSKDKILEMYLNTVYFGQGAYGVEAAAKTYFSMSADHLTLSQAATLAGVIASPARFDPVFHPDLAIRRRDLVLGRMLALHMIDLQDYERATRAKLKLDVSHPTRYPAPYFVDYVKHWFLVNPAFGATYEERYRKLFEGGLRIYTTIDLRLQRLAEQAVHSILAYRKDPYGAMTVLDPRTGAVRAMVGGRNYFSRKDPYAKLNLATGGATGRQAGSSFKPFALVAALERGISPHAVYPAPSHLSILLPRGYSPRVWPVDNYDGEGGGSMTLEQATINSVNTVYAQLIMQLGAKTVVDTARRMGIATDLGAYPSAVLGTNEVNTVEMASANGTLATLGKHVPPRAVEKITDAQGRLIYSADPQPKQVVSPTVAWTTNQILEKVVHFGTGSQANIGRPAAGKTGTGQVWRDAWFVGYIPQLVAAVWVGFPKGQISMSYPTVRIRHVLGGTWPAEIWHAFMVKATRKLPVLDWEKPETGRNLVRMDVTRGCVANRWTLPFDVEVVEYESGIEPTNVCAEPSGPQIVDLPSVVGLDLESARALLESYAFVVRVQYEEVPGAAPGTVLGQDPAPGVGALQGTEISITAEPGTYVPPAAPTPSPSPSPSPMPTPTYSPSPSPTPKPSSSPSASSSPSPSPSSSPWGFREGSPRYEPAPLLHESPGLVDRHADADPRPHSDGAGGQPLPLGEIETLSGNQIPSVLLL